MKAIIAALWVALCAAGPGIPPAFGRPVDYQTVQEEGGKYFRYRKVDNGYLLVLVPGQEIIRSLAAFQKAMGFGYATVTGLGDVEKVRITHFNAKSRKMDPAPIIEDSNEMTSLVCSLSIFLDPNTGERTPLPHCHINVGLSSADGNRVVGGHLVSATVSVVGELFIAASSQEVLKTHDAPFNGNLFDLNLLDTTPAR